MRVEEPGEVAAQDAGTNVAVDPVERVLRVVVGQFVVGQLLPGAQHGHEVAQRQPRRDVEQACSSRAKSSSR